MAYTVTYSFLDVQCTIVGPGGYINLGAGSGAADEGITFEMDDDKNVKNIGADGTGQNSLRASRGGSAMVRLLKTSSTNGLLSNMYQLQQVSSALWGKNIISLSNPVNGDSVTGQGSAFVRQPSMVSATVAGINEWRFSIIQLDMLFGGNNA